MKRRLGSRTVRSLRRLWLSSFSSRAGQGWICAAFFREQCGDVLIIAVSVLESRDLAVEAGADAFLLKPVEPLQLVSTVRDLLGSSAFLRPGQEPAP